MKFTVAITGARDLSGRPQQMLRKQFDAVFPLFTQNKTHWILGGATGIDTFALDWLVAAGHPSTVVVPVRLDDQPDDAKLSVLRATAADPGTKLIELKHSAGVGVEAWNARNQWMVDNSNLVIGFPSTAEPDDSGTWHTLQYAARRGRAYMVIPPEWSRAQPWP